MCDVCHLRAAWKGWLPLPGSRHLTPVGEWVDLSHCLRDELSRISLLPPPSFRRISRMPESHANITDIHMVAHVGTHLDAPCHFIPDGPTADGIPLDRLYGPGVVWKIDVPPLGTIGVEHLERATPKMHAGDIVILSTGWWKHINTPLYEDQPSLSTEAAEWLVGQGAKILAVDFATPDLTVRMRPPDFQWPVHQILLSQGVLIAEHVTNLDSLAGYAVEAMFAGLNILGSDGLPARPLARRVA